MFKNLDVNSKLNAILLVYVLSALFFQPLAITIQVGMIIFLFYRKEIKSAFYGLILFSIMNFVFYCLSLHKLSQNDWLMTTILVVSVLLNLIWFVAVIKALKLIYYNQSESVKNTDLE